MYIKLDSVDKVKEFNQLVSGLEEEIDLVSGRYIIDAKSLLGVFSFDLSKPIEVQTYGESDTQNVQNALQKYVCEKNEYEKKCQYAG